MKEDNPNNPPVLCTNCQKHITREVRGKGNHYCSRECSKEWLNKNYYLTHKIERKGEFQDRYLEKKQTAIKFKLNRIRTLTNEHPLDLLLLPNTRKDETDFKHKHLELHGVPTVIIKQFYYRVGECKLCGDIGYVILPQPFKTDEELYLNRLIHQFRDINIIRRVDKLHGLKKYLIKKGRLNEAKVVEVYIGMCNSGLFNQT